MTWFDSDGKYHIKLGAHLWDNHHIYDETIILQKCNDDFCLKQAALVIYLETFYKPSAHKV